MSIQINSPMINTNLPPTEQLKSMQSYLFRMSEQLTYALNNLDSGNFSDETSKALKLSIDNNDNAKEKNDQAYNNLKALIIKTADIIYSEQQRIETELKSSYVAKSDFGEYKEENRANIEANAEGITQSYEQISSLKGNLDKISSDFTDYKVNTSSYIKTGILYYDENGLPRTGVAVGDNLQTIIKDGKEEIVRKDLLATFTSDKLTFWQNNIEVAFLSNNILYITNVRILGNLYIGNWEIDTTYGFTLKWNGADS